MKRQKKFFKIVIIHLKKFNYCDIFILASRFRDEFDSKRVKYDRDMEELAFSMQKLQQQINELAGQRDNELTGIERKLHDLEDKAYELKQSWNDDD